MSHCSSIFASGSSGSDQWTIASQLPPAAGFILRCAVHRDVREAFAGEDLLHRARGDLAAVAVAAEVAEHDVPQCRVADVF